MWCYHVMMLVGVVLSCDDVGRCGVLSCDDVGRCGVIM